MPFILLASQKYYTINSFPPEWFNLGTLLKRLRKKLKFLQSGLTNAEFVMTRLNSLSCTCINLEIIERLKVDFTWNVVPLGPVRDAMWKVLCGVQILTRASLIHLFVFLKQKMWHVELSLYSIALPGPLTHFLPPFSTLLWAPCLHRALLLQCLQAEHTGHPRMGRASHRTLLLWPRESATCGCLLKGLMTASGITLAGWAVFPLELYLGVGKCQLLKHSIVWGFTVYGYSLFIVIKGVINHQRTCRGDKIWLELASFSTDPSA